MKTVAPTTMAAGRIISNSAPRKPIKQAPSLSRPEIVLGTFVALLGEGTQQSQRRRVHAQLVSGNSPFVGGNALLVGGNGGLKRPSGYRSSKADGRHERGDGCLHHVGPCGPLRRPTESGRVVSGLVRIPEPIKCGRLR